MIHRICDWRIHRRAGRDRRDFRTDFLCRSRRYNGWVFI